MGPYGGRLGCSGAPKGFDWGALGPLWGSIGVLWGPYEGRPGCSGASVGSTVCGGRLGCPGAPMGVDWGALGPLWGSTGVLEVALESTQGFGPRLSGPFLVDLAGKYVCFVYFGRDGSLERSTGGLRGPCGGRRGALGTIWGHGGGWDPRTLMVSIYGRLTICSREISEC